MSVWRSPWYFNNLNFSIEIGSAPRTRASATTYNRQLMQPITFILNLPFYLLIGGL
jgi:hypothetical protein